MLISTMVLVVLRLFSIQWFLQGLVLSASAIVQLPRRSTDHLFLGLASGIVMLVASVVAWFVAPSLARFIAGKYDGPVSVPVPPLRDLYAFAFVFLGLYFVIQSLGEAILRFHYAMLVAATAGDFDPNRQQTGYELLRSLITLVGGLLCIIFGKTWAGKLSGTKAEPSAQAQPALFAYFVYFAVKILDSLRVLSGLRATPKLYLTRATSGSIPSPVLHNSISTPRPARFPSSCPTTF